MSLDMEKRFKGIKIGDTHYKLIQFADDTAPLIGDWRRESKYVDRGLLRWCKATGMRENIAKREAVALGAYRGRRMPDGPKLGERRTVVQALRSPNRKRPRTRKMVGGENKRNTTKNSRMGGPAAHGLLRKKPTHARHVLRQTALLAVLVVYEQTYGTSSATRCRRTRLGQRPETSGKLESRRRGSQR